MSDKSDTFQLLSCKFKDTDLKSERTYFTENKMNRLSVLGQKLDKNVQFEIETIRTVTFIIVRSNIQTFKHDQTFP